VPHNDAHDSEYIADEDERIAYISGFTGSAGIALILMDRAYLWTDSRYWL
jgi:Xaa-Pro aminopeptidase